MNLHGKNPSGVKTTYLGEPLSESILSKGRPSRSVKLTTGKREFISARVKANVKETMTISAVSKGDKSKTVKRKYKPNEEIQGVEVSTRFKLQEKMTQKFCFGVLVSSWAGGTMFGGGGF